MIIFHIYGSFINVNEYFSTYIRQELLVDVDRSYLFIDLVEIIYLLIISHLILVKVFSTFIDGDVEL